MTGPELDVAVVGDGPAGLALAAACRDRGVRVVVVGPDQPWIATYGTWVDDVADLPAHCFGATSPSVVVHTTRRQVVERPYGVLDGDALRRHLGGGLERLRTAAEGVQHFDWGSRVRFAEGDDVDARLVVDAAGRGGLAGAPPAPAAWQSAYGVVLDAPPSRFDADRPTFMDLRSVGRSGGPPTFCYVVPVHDGWLVEETVLAAPARVDAGWLADRLAARLGADAPPAGGPAGRVEVVHIPMGGRLPSARQPVVAFGAAAGYTNPVTGFSVATALRAAPRVATAIADALSTAGRPDVRPIHRAVWPTSLRRTRRLHDHGLNVLVRLPENELAEFFACFFDLPTEEWSAYLRVDSPPGAVSRAMVAQLRRLPWRVRRRLVTTPPWPRWPAESAASA